MYSYYRRIRRELERIDLLFPEMRSTGKKYARRRTSWKRFLQAPLKGQIAFGLFQIIENDVTILHHIGVKYAERGIFVPEQILREPRSQLLIEIKRLESRLILELCLLTIAGLIPPIAMLL